jgi:hypothetical protein
MAVTSHQQAHRMKRTLLIALFAALVLPFAALGQQTNPDAARLKADAKELDHLQKFFTTTPQFGGRFWRESRRVADERGPVIIHAIMVRGRTWRGEEGLIFLPLVALLPRDATLKLLKQYERSKRETDRVWAREFQVEFEADDTQEGVRKYSKSK